MKAIAALALSAPLLLGALQAGATEMRVACILVGVHGARAALSVERSGERLEPVPYLLLREGDRLVVGDPTSRLVTRCGARDAAITQKQSPHEIRYEGAPPALPENLREWVMQFLSGGSDMGSAAASTSLNVRGEEDSWPLEVPLLTSRSTRVAAARDRIALGWRGGAPPYAVRLYDARRRLVVAEVRAADEPLATLVLPRGLEPGGHEVEIVDANGRFARGEFDAVAPETIPAAPRSLAKTQPSDAITATLRAAWVASESDGIFALEAFQIAAPAADSHQPAALLLRSLRMGHFPDAPPEGLD